jgi:hypothetical protein
MVGGISGADATRSRNAAVREPLTFGRIVVIGGGCYGSWYAGQLAKAAERGALIAREVVVVDRNPQCTVASRLRDGVYAAIPLTLETTTWDSYLESWLAMGTSALAQDALVPSPLMPHLCLDWLMARARVRWPARTVEVRPLPRAPEMPWERAAPDGRHYVSYATWTCPVNCIEPARCPATRGVRDWSMPPALVKYVEAEVQGSEGRPPMRGPVIFHCVHRTYGVGMIDAAGIAAADDDIAKWGDGSPIAVLVGTVSHCHGALGMLHIA